MGNTRFMSRFGGLFLAAVLSACGGDAQLGGSTTGGGTTGGGTLGGTTGGTTGGDPPPAPVYRAGFLNGSTFNANQIFIADDTLEAGGQSALRVDVVDDSGTRVTGVSATVTFTSDCITAGTSRVVPATSTTANGRIDVTYTAQGCSGTDEVTAIVNVNSVATLQALGELVIQPSEVGAIQFVSATPAAIGMTGSPVPGQSVVQFKVVDQSGGVVANQLVQFSLSTTTGGIKLTPTEARTDATGVVQTIVSSGSRQASVVVTAKTNSPLSGLPIPPGVSDPIAVTTGIPDADSVSISATKLSIDGTCDGEPTTINVRLADRYNNPVPGGQQPLLTTEGGKISGNCVTADPSSPTVEAGVCSVLLNVQNPRPANGRSTVLAYVPGEEVFADLNGNGFFDGSDTFTDLGEVFRDDNENSTFDSGEFFQDDFGSANGAYDGGNGQFDGYICTSPGVGCQTRSKLVGGNIVIVFSTRTLGGSVPFSVDVAPTLGTFDPGGPQLTLTKPKAIATVLVTLKDSNGNPLPTGTTYSLDSTVGSIIDPATQGPFNTNDSSNAANTFAFSLQAPDGTTPDNGLVSARVNIPASACDGERIITVPLFQVAYIP